MTPLKIKKFKDQKEFYGLMEKDNLFKFWPFKSVESKMIVIKMQVFNMEETSLKFSTHLIFHLSGCLRDATLHRLPYSVWLWP